MARFAGGCQNKFAVLVQKLEVTLGPDTAELGMRFGLHSGAVTAGVLRGMSIFWLGFLLSCLIFSSQLDMILYNRRARSLSALWGYR